MCIMRLTIFIHFLKIFFIFWFIYCMCAYSLKGSGHRSGGQRTTIRTQFSLSTTRVSGVRLRLLGGVGDALTTEPLQWPNYQ